MDVLPLLNVVAPAGVKANQLFTVITPSGEPLNVPLPPEVKPGQIFTVIVPAHTLLHPPQTQMTQVTQITQITNIYQMSAVQAAPQPAALQPAKTVAKLPTPLEMQRIGDQHRQQEREVAATQQRPPPMESFHCACIGEVQPTAGGSRWELPRALRTCGVITDVEMDLRNQTFAPRKDNRTPETRLNSCACISNTELLVPPEVSVAKSGCGGCISNLNMKDRRPAELRGTMILQPKGIVRVGGCALIHNVDVTILEHGQPLPKGFFHWFFGGDHFARPGAFSSVKREQ